MVVATLFILSVFIELAHQLIERVFKDYIVDMAISHRSYQLITSILILPKMSNDKPYFSTEKTNLLLKMIFLRHSIYNFLF